MNRKNITHGRSLVLMEEVLNKYNETLFKNKDTKEYKSFPLAMMSVQKAWEKSFDKDRLKIIACMDQKEYIKEIN